MATGTATINFGTNSATGRRATASVDVTGQSGLASTSFIEAFAMAESTTDQTAEDVRADPVTYICQFLSATSFRIFGTCVRGHTWGDRKVRWVTKA